MHIRRVLHKYKYITIHKRADLYRLVAFYKLLNKIFREIISNKSLRFALYESHPLLYVLDRKNIFDNVKM